MPTLATLLCPEVVPPPTVRVTMTMTRENEEYSVTVENKQVGWIRRDAEHPSAFWIFVDMTGERVGTHHRARADFFNAPYLRDLVVRAGWTI